MMAMPTFMLNAPTSFAAAEANMLPIVLAALLLDVSIVAVWYFIGVVIANDGVKESAKGEYYQFLGTAFLVVLLVWGITTYSGVSYTVLGSTKLMNPATMLSLCGSIEKGSHLDLIGAANSLLSGAQTPSGTQLVGICNMLDGDTLTDKVNYPLAAAAVVTANLTAQTANNINGAYTYDAYIGFLSTLKPVIALCFAPPEAVQCLVPGGAILGKYFRVSLTYGPYAGFGMLYSGMQALGTLLNLSFEAYVAQLLIISIILYVWPYLLFTGIVLRSTFFTRKMGGLMIAIALGAVVIFPTIFGIEYVSLGNGIPGTSYTSLLGSQYGLGSAANTTYGFNPITPIPKMYANTIEGGPPVAGNYILNFFVTPSMQDIASANGCWPKISSTGAIADIVASGGLGGSVGSLFSSPLVSAELADIFYLLNPLTNVGSGIGQLVSAIGTSSSGTFFLPAYCPVQGGLATNLEMLNAYGVIGVTSYFLPIINLIMTLSAIIGMSGLMGGDTNLEGLSRFV